MIPTLLIVLPYFVADKITLTEAEELDKRLKAWLNGMRTDDTDIRLIVNIVEGMIEDIRKKGL